MAAIANAIWSLIIVAMQHLTDVGDVIAKLFSNNRGGLALGQVPQHQPLAACDWVAGSAVSSFEFILLQMRSNC